MPTVHPTTYVDVAAQIIGDVVLGPECSVWMNAVIRDDVNHVRIGAQTNIQDGTIVHVMRGTHPTTLGDSVSVGHGAVIHGCTVESVCLIGMGAIVLNGPRIGTESIVAAGSVVPEGAQIPPRSLVLGVPGRVRRGLSDEEVESIRGFADRYVEYKKNYGDDGE